jgi:type IX secretion system PorP/SprF family membrane protein
LTGYYYKINVNETSFGDTNEPLLNDILRRGVFVPDIDFGIYLLNPKYDVGLSALQLVGAAAKFGNSSYKNYWMDRHYYLFGSYDFNSGIKTILEPSVLFKISEQLKPQADIGLTYIHNQSFYAGLAYRTGGAIIANIRFKYIPGNVKMTSMFFGYAFDFTLDKIQRSTYGTHEITIALKLGDSAKRFRWLDRY